MKFQLFFIVIIMTMACNNNQDNNGPSSEKKTAGKKNKNLAIEGDWSEAEREKVMEECRKIQKKENKSGSRGEVEETCNCMLDVFVKNLTYNEYLILEQQGESDLSEEEAVELAAKEKNFTPELRKCFPKDEE